MGTPKYAPAARAHVLALYTALGAAEASRETGVAVGTILDWAKADGVEGPPDTPEYRAEQTRAANEANAQRRERMSARRAQVQELLIERAHLMLERMEFEDTPARDCQRLALAAAICIDKFRLEMGDVTERTELVNEATARAQIADAVDQLAQRRRESAATGS